MKRRTWVSIIVLVLLPLTILLIWQITSAFRPVVTETTSQPETRIRITFEKPSEADLVQQFGEEDAVWIGSLPEWEALPPFAGFTAQWDDSRPCPTWSTLADATFFWDLALVTPEEVIPVRYWRIWSCEIYVGH